MTYIVTEKFSYGWTIPKAILGTGEEAPRQHVYPFVSRDTIERVEVHSIPFATLRNLWLAKFGYALQNIDEINADPFYREVAIILEKRNQLGIVKDEYNNLYKLHLTLEPNADTK